MKQVKVKKIKKIPKYADGTGNAGTSVLNTMASSYTPFSGSISKAPAGGNLTGSPTITPGGKSTGNNYGGYSNTHIPSGLTTGANELIKSTFGIDQNSTAAVMMDSTAQGAELGMSVAGPWGALIGAGVGFGLGSFKGDSIDYSKISTTSDIADSYVAGGIFGGGNKDKLLRDAAQYQNSLAATELTSHMRAKWANDPRNQSMTFNAKDGGIVPDVVHAKVSKGELYYDPYTRTLSRVPGSPNKPNTNDDVHAFVKEGGMIVPNSEDQPLLNGKTQAIALAPMIDKPGKKMSEGTIAARDAIVRKTVRRNEMAKLNKPENRNKILHASKGDIVPYSYNKDMSQFEYWDKDKNDYKKEYIDWVNSLTDQDVKDIYSGKYGDMSTYLGKNKDYIPTVELARMLMTDKKYGDWHKIAKAAKTQMDKKGPVRPVKTAILPIEGGIRGTNNPYAMKIGDTPQWISKKPEKNGLGRFGEIMDTIADYAPLIAAYANKPKWDVESASTWIPEYVPVAVDKANQIRAIKDVINTSKYNIKNISPSTGAYMAYASNAASQAAKQYADIYTDKTNEEFARIAHNAGIHNQWAPQIAAAIDQAKANTQANKAAAYAQRDINIKDAMSYLRDQQMLPFLKQYLSSGAYNSSIKKLA